MEASQLDQAKLNFEREKWLSEQDNKKAEIEIRYRELSLREEEHNLRAKEFNRSRWNSPILLSVLAALGTGIFGLIIASKNSESARDVEIQKAESAMILDATKEKTDIDIVRKIKLLVDLDLIKDVRTKKMLIDYYGFGRLEKWTVTPAASPLTRIPSSREGVLGERCDEKDHSLIVYYPLDFKIERQSHLGRCVLKLYSEDYPLSNDERNNSEHYCSYRLSGRLVTSRKVPVYSRQGILEGKPLCVFDVSIIKF